MPDMIIATFIAVSGSLPLEEGCIGNLDLPGIAQNPFALEKGVYLGWIFFFAVNLLQAECRSFCLLTSMELILHQTAAYCNYILMI